MSSGLVFYHIMLNNFNFLSNGGNYKDNGATPIFYSSAKIYLDFICHTNSYDTSNGSLSKLIGVISRDVQSTTTSSNYFSCFNGYNVSKTINAPTQNLFTVSIYNTSSNALLTNTDAANPSVPTADMTAYILMIEFTPI